MLEIYPTTQRSARLSLDKVVDWSKMAINSTDGATIHKATDPSWRMISEDVQPASDSHDTAPRYLL